MKSIEERVKALEEKVLPTGRIHVAVVQDRSGSMGGRENDVINGFNEYLTELLKDENSEQMRLTLAQFDTEYNTLHEAVSLGDVKELNRDTYTPRGMTALYDAIGMTVETIQKQMKTGDRALMIIMTDGLENSSRKYNRDAITKLIKECQDSDQWTFVYLGADLDAFQGGTSIGIHGGNTLTFDSNDHSGTYRSLAGATAGYTSSGVTSSPAFVQDFIEPDPTNDVTIDKDDEDEDESGQAPLWTPDK
jgi:uncharacterized protein YegL